MRVLVTGGTGVIGAGLIPALQSRHHTVRLLSRHAENDARQWMNVEPFEGDVADRLSIEGAAEGCDAIIHVAGIVAEELPDVTFDRVNVQGTRHVVEEAARAGVSRLVYVSSLGADSGESEYHRSKLRAEEEISRARCGWTIIRPGLVYGPGDEIISLILRMVRTLPAVPVVDFGNQRFQPVWHQDLGHAIAASLAGDHSGQTLEVAGPEITSMADVIDRLREITGRSPLRVPVPMAIAGIATAVAGAIGKFPIDENKLTMLREENVIRPDRTNALGTLLGTPATSLDDGLRLLADALPEQLPDDGVGSMEHKRFWADISGSTERAATLMRAFCERVTEIMPIEFAAEPGAATQVEKGATMTGAIPFRGNIQVRVETVEPNRVIFATLEGHPLAGIVEFSTSDENGLLRFAIDIYTRAANVFDFVAMKTVGAPAQSANWRTVVQRMVDLSGGTSPGVMEETRTLDEGDAEEAQRRIRALVQSRQREESAGAEDSA